MSKAFTLLTLAKAKFVCVPCEGGVGFIDQEGCHYGQYSSREAFKSEVTRRGGLEACRIGTAHLEIVEKQLFPTEGLTNPTT